MALLGFTISARKMKNSFNKLTRNPRLKSILFGLAALFVLAIIAATAFVVWKKSDPKVEVTYIEAGQGDSILIRTSDHKVALIDGSYPNGKALAYLQSHGVKHIDLVVVTHAHDDHTGGIPEILNAIPVDRLVWNGQELDSPIFDDFHQAMLDHGLGDVVKVGDRLELGRVALDVLAPTQIFEVPNNNSVVTRLVVGKVTFLFAGDAMRDEEQWMMEYGVPLKAQILKVGHHAADTSSSEAFIRQVSPEAAIYTAETGNIHHFPHQVTLDTLKSVGATIYGTDVNGTVTVSTDGKTYTVDVDRGEPH